MKTNFLVLLTTILLLFNYVAKSQTRGSLPFQAGAAKINITPAPDALPSDYDKILDSLYTRAVVIDNGKTSAVLVSIDNGMLSESIWKNVTEGINKEVGIPVENIFLSPSHTHSAPFLTLPPQAQNNLNDPITSAYITKVEKAIIEVTKKAKSKLQPARIGFGTGTSYLNVNRDVIDPETRLWVQGPNYDGPSDKTVAVIKIESMSGDLIAVYFNYAMHANLMYMSGMISAGMPGGIAKYIEDYYKNFHDDNAVALWTMGAAGDQNPIYFGSILSASMSKTEAAVSRQIQMINSVGQILGEEVIRILEKTKKLDDKISIYGSQKIVTCPGRDRTDTNNRQGKPGSYVDGDPVNIKLSLLLLGDIALAGVDAEVYNIIAQRVKEESPLTKTVFVSITNGSANSGYIPSDDAFQKYTFQVLSSRLKTGCAETKIVNGLVEMIDKEE